MKSPRIEVSSVDTWEGLAMSSEVVFGNIIGIYTDIYAPRYPRLFLNLVYRQEQYERWYTTSSDWVVIEDCWSDPEVHDDWINLNLDS